ncbi:MAG: hypothetical protein H0U64_00940, partial [Gemmatimonadaceae bacterium]|nr:hypothetical protein [Gemmatimonadaceae bacterium]
QTCRGSHTHTVLVDPKDSENVYIYVSGSAPVRSATELRGCVGAIPEKDSSSSLFRIEVIKVPLAHPERASIVSSPRIFNGLAAPVKHPDAPEDIEAAANALAKARSTGGFVGIVRGTEEALSEEFIKPLLDSVVAARGGTGAATAADTAALRPALPALIARRYPMPFRSTSGELLGPSQCHDITVYPAIGLAGGACAGYGLLLDIRDPVNPVRIGSVSDPNFSYWHSATFNNDGSKVLFTDEWGGGSHPKCRSTDKPEWGANAIFSIAGRTMNFRSYYKLPAPQTREENCVAHNGSLIPIPGRDVMVQSWYQGGISLFDWTDPSHPVEIGFFDRGPVDSTRNVLGGSWSAYWYNGVIVSSEIVRGLDILELVPSEFISQNEIDAAKSVHFEYLNAQGQRKLEWPPSFALVGAYVDQLQRSHSLSPASIADVRGALTRAQSETGARRQELLSRLAKDLGGFERTSRDPEKVTMLTNAVRALSASGQ